MSFICQCSSLLHRPTLRLSILSALMATALLVGPEFSLAQTATFHDIGSLSTQPPPGSLRKSSGALGVSWNGQIVVGLAEIDEAFHAFQWTRDDGISSLGALPITDEELEFALAADLSSDGSIIVGHSVNDGGRVACVWRNGELVVLGDLPDANPQFGETHSQAEAVSADGAVIVGRGTDANRFDRAFVWTEAKGMFELENTKEAQDISADGTVIVGDIDRGDVSEAFRWRVDTGVVGLGFLPEGDYSEGFGVSGDGTVVVGVGDSINNRTEAFRWTEADGMVGLGDLPGGSNFRSTALAASASGVVIVGSSDAGDYDYPHPFIWTADMGMRNLATILIDEFGLTEVANWKFLGPATGISPDGRTIVGEGRLTDNDDHGWVITLPESFVNDPAAESLPTSSDFSVFEGFNTNSNEYDNTSTGNDNTNNGGGGLCGPSAASVSAMVLIGLVALRRRM